MADRGAPPKAVKVRLTAALSMPSAYATNFSVQGTTHEFIITFYEARPPVITGTPEEQAAQWAKVSEVEAVPLARILIAASRMPEFLQVLREADEKVQGLADVKQERSEVKG